MRSTRSASGRKSRTKESQKCIAFFENTRTPSTIWFRIWREYGMYLKNAKIVTSEIALATQHPVHKYSLNSRNRMSMKDHSHSAQIAGFQQLCMF